METPVTFTSRGRRLVGMLHMPGGEGPFPAVVMLHGFTGNHIEPHRLFVKAARRFASGGIAALRFDFHGCGDSEGEFEEITITGMVEDALAGLAFTRGREGIDPGRVGLLGLSLGGAIAARAAVTAKAPPACLVLWAAVADMKRAFSTLAPPAVADNFGRRRVHDFHGSAVSQRFLDELVAFRPAEGLDRYAGPVLVVHGEGDEEISPEDAETFMRSAGGGGAEMRLIPGADHCFCSLAWQRELYDVTARFLEGRLRGR